MFNKFNNPTNNGLRVGEQVQNIYTYEKAVVIKNRSGEILGMIKNGDVVDVSSESWLRSNIFYDEIPRVLAKLSSIE